MSCGEKSPERAWETPISLLSWTSRSATGFRARISPDPHSARGLHNADYPPRARLRCPGLPPAEPFFPVNFVQLAAIQGNVVAWPLSRGRCAQRRGKRPGKQVGSGCGCSSCIRRPASVSRCGRAGRRRGVHGSASLVSVTPPPRSLRRPRAAPAAKEHGGSRAPARLCPRRAAACELSELMRRSCSGDFCLCTYKVLGEGLTIGCLLLRCLAGVSLC